VMHRAAGYIQISLGNHKVTMLPALTTNHGIVLYHYGVRDLETFTRKMVKGGQELERNPSKHGGRHWRYFYDLYKKGKLTEEYYRIIGRSTYDRLVADGHIVEDNPVPDVLQTAKRQLYI